ncbi:MAG: protein kinase, partial [Oscillospiraceae bacterium]|nr:protein kinase [Oscillospiraceae bacterium]
MQRCLGCMRAFGEEFDVCPHCGYIVGTGAASKNYLEPGTVLQNRYTLGKVLGQGGFGITYIAWDQRLEIPVAVKEFFPTSFAARMTGSNDISCFDDESRHYFESGMNNVLDESRRLARFTHLENVVRVHNCFEENNTAYIVMELLRGETVQDILRRDGKMTLEQSMGIMMPILQALEEIHRTGLVHRDISPDNIFVCESGQAKLLDFGAARIVNGYDQKTLSIILKKGFAPIEQYNSHGTQGTFTDVYAVCATLYKMLTGVAPEDSLSRSMQDSLRPISDMVSIPKSIERILQKGMAVQASDRIQSAGELCARLRQALQDEQTCFTTQKERKKKHRITFNGKRTKTIRTACIAASAVELVVFVVCMGLTVRNMVFLSKGEPANEPQTEVQTEAQEPYISEARALFDMLVIRDGGVEYLPDMIESYKPLYAANSDTVGYLKIPGTSIDTVVVQSSTDNGMTDSYKYLKNDFYGEFTKYGNVFLDYRCGKYTLSRNTILYGHTTEDGQQVFYDLAKYEDPEFFKQNPIIEYSTLYNHSKWKIFAVFATSVNASDDGGYVF